MDETPKGMVIREQHSEELEDRMKCIAAEIKMEKEPTKADNGIPVSKKEPNSRTFVASRAPQCGNEI